MGVLAIVGGTVGRRVETWVGVAVSVGSGVAVGSSVGVSVGSGVSVGNKRANLVGPNARATRVGGLNAVICSARVDEVNEVNVNPSAPRLKIPAQARRMTAVRNETNELIAIPQR